MSDAHKTEIVPAAPRTHAIERERMHPMVAAAFDAGRPDPAMLEKLLDLQERWEAGEAKKAYTASMVALKRDLPRVIGHDKTVSYDRVKFTHTSLAKAVEEIVPVLTDYGFSHSWIPRTESGRVYVTCRLTHAGGHSEETTLDSPADSKGAKSGPQAIMATITSLQRYTLLGLLGIATADMPDASGDGHAEEPRAGDRIDARANMRAVDAVIKAGLTRQMAEEHIGRTVDRWTVSDLATLKAWIKPNGEAA